MPDLTKPVPIEQIEAWPPLTPDDIYAIEDKSLEQFDAVFKGDMGAARVKAMVHANEIAAMWPRIVTTAMMLWEAQEKLKAAPPTEGGQWISVNDRLPDVVNKKYLVHNTDPILNAYGTTSYVDVMIFFRNRRFGGNALTHSKIKHWCELPPPPGQSELRGAGRER